MIWVMHGDYDYDEEKQEYTVGDTLTTMLYDQFKQMDAAKITSDVDLDVEAVAMEEVFNQRG